MAIAPASVYDLRCPRKTDEQVVNAVVEQYKRVWHGESPDKVIIDRRNSDGSYQVRAVVITRDAPRVTLFEVSSDLFASRV